MWDAAMVRERIDAVIMAHVLEHTHSPKKYLGEAFRILKPGGILAITVPYIGSYSFDVFKSGPPVNLCLS